MKVVHISVSNNGGAGIAAYRLHCSLLDFTDVESQFVQQFGGDAGNDRNVYTVEANRSLIHRIKRQLGVIPEVKNCKLAPRFSASYEIATFPTTSYRIEELPLIKEADIIHLHWVADFLNYPTFFSKIKKPIVWSMHDLNPFQGLFHYEDDTALNRSQYEDIDTSIVKLKEKYITSNVDLHIACPSEWIKNKSEQSRIMSSFPHYVIPHAIDFKFYPELDKAQAKKEIGVDDSKLTLLFVAHGLHIRRKGFDLLLKALSSMHRTDFNLITVGEGLEYISSNISADINHIHIDRTSDVSKLNTIYSAADMTVIPSREDVFNLVMLESMVNGTPVISFANGGMAEHVRNNETGILVTDTNAEALAKNITDFLDNEYSFDKNIVRKYAEQNFSAEVQAQQFEKLYKEILK